MANVNRAVFFWGGGYPQIPISMMKTYLAYTLKRKQSKLIYQIEKSAGESF